MITAPSWLGTATLTVTVLTVTEDGDANITAVYQVTSPDGNGILSYHGSSSGEITRVDGVRVTYDDDVAEVLDHCEDHEQGDTFRIVR